MSLNWKTKLIKTVVSPKTSKSASKGQISIFFPSSENAHLKVCQSPFFSPKLLQFWYLTCQTVIKTCLLKIMLQLIFIGQIGECCRVKNILSKISLSLLQFVFQFPKKHGAGANYETVYLFRAQFLTNYWYLAEDTLFWPKIDAPVTKHYLP